MPLGSKISKLRREHGWSQQFLADKLNVSRQTVYKWECDDVMPERDKLAKLVTLFETSYDYLLDDSTDGDGQTQPEPSVEEAPVEEEVKKQDEVSDGAVAPAVTAEPVKIPVGTCDDCLKPIYVGDIIHKVTIPGGRGRPSSQKKICDHCYNKTQMKECGGKVAKLNHSNKLGIIWAIVGAIVMAILLIVFIVVDSKYKTALIVTFAIATVFIPIVIYTLFLDNTFLSEVFLGVWSWGFKQMPGIIFSLDFDGIAFLIVAKILLAILSFTLAAACFLLAVILCVILSPIAFPLAITRYKRDLAENQAQYNKYKAKDQKYIQKI